jgi:hypothetical protein
MRRTEVSRISNSASTLDFEILELYMKGVSVLSKTGNDLGSGYPTHECEATSCTPKIIRARGESWVKVRWKSMMKALLS